MVQSNALARLDIDAPDTTEGSGEDLEKYSKEEWNETKLGIAEALRENTDKHESIATAQIHGANKKGNESEDESEEEEEITKVDPGEPKPAWEGLERGRNDNPKIIKTPHSKRVLQANSPIHDSHRVRKKGAIEAGNYPLAVKDVGNGTPEQRDRLKNQSGKMGTSPRGRADSIMGRANWENSHVLEGGGEEARVELKKRLSIIIGIQFDRLGKTLAQFHTTFGSQGSSKLGKQAENGKKDSQDVALHIRAPGQPRTKGL